VSKEALNTTNFSSEFQILSQEKAKSYQRLNIFVDATRFGKVSPQFGITSSKLGRNISIQNTTSQMVWFKLTLQGS
jgi:hypothetical protein